MNTGFSLRIITRAGLIAAMYVVLTVTPGLNALSFGPVQFRVSEMLMALAAFEWAAVPGLWIGCMIANSISQFGILDITLGAGLTLVAALGMRLAGNSWWGLSGFAFPVALNALGVAFIIVTASPAGDGVLFWPTAASVGAGEAAVMATLGIPLFVLLKRNPELIGLARQH